MHVSWLPTVGTICSEALPSGQSLQAGSQISCRLSFSRAPAAGHCTDWPHCRWQDRGVPAASPAPGSRAHQRSFSAGLQRRGYWLRKGGYPLDCLAFYTWERITCLNGLVWLHWSPHRLGCFPSLAAPAHTSSGSPSRPQRFTVLHSVVHSSCS